MKVEEDLKKKHKDINQQFVKTVTEIKNESFDVEENIFGQIADKSQALQKSFVNRENDLLSCKYTAVDELYDSFKDVFGDAFKINRFLFKTFFSYDMFDNTIEISLIFRSICPVEDRIKVNTNAICKTYDVEKSLDSGKSYPFTQKIIEELKKDSLPVGISYCSRVLSRGSNYAGITTKTKSSLVFKKDKNGKNDCGNHASVIIGSRWNPQKKSCELLIRNSWGAQCTSYRKYYPSKKYFSQKHPGVKSSQYDIKCEAGNIWVDYKQLEKNIYRVQHL